MRWLDRYSEALRVGRRFTAELLQHRRRLGGVLVLFLGVAGLEVLRPWPLKWIFDGALTPTSPMEHGFGWYVWTGAGAFAAIVLVKALTEYFARLRLTEVGHAVTRGLRYRIFSHLARLSPSFHARHKTGDLLVRLIGDVPMLRTMLVDSSVELLARLLLIVGTVGVMLAVDPILSAIVIAIVPMLALLVRFLSRRITIAVRKQRRKEGVLAEYLHEALEAAPLLQSLGRSDHAVRRFARSNRTSARAGLKTARLGARLSATVESMLGIAMAMTLVAGSYRVGSGHITPGELLVFLSYVRGLLKPVRAASKHGEKIAKGTACGDRILELLDEDVQIQSAPDAVPAPPHPHELRFEDVHFAYGGTKDALHGFATTFRRGELVGLFGPSGAGKSTVAALSVRLHDPQLGAVLLDGHDLRRLDLSSLRDCFGTCLQDTVLFGDTIRENLLLGKPDATDEELRVALQHAGATAFVDELAGGLDTCLGAAGAGLSGGERRRLSLARTLLRQSPVLILDEPFAGLDRQAVEIVRRSLEEYSARHLVIVVAHDLDHLEAFDRIVFLDRGRVAAEGSHAELLTRNRRYREIVRAVPEEVA